MPLIDSVQTTLQATVEVARGVVKQLPQKGNSAEECQRTAILDALQTLEQCINGLTLDDQMPGEHDIPGDGELRDVARSMKALQDSMKQLGKHYVSVPMELAAGGLSR